MSPRRHFRLPSLVVVLLIACAPAFAQEKPFDEPPVPLKTVPPTYPFDLKRDGIKGMVSIEITIGADGTVTEASIRKSTHPQFEAPATEAIRRWKFKPAKKAGQPVAVKVVVPMKFEVND